MIYHTHTGEQYKISACGQHVSQVIDGREVGVGAALADTILQLVRQWQWERQGRPQGGYSGR